MSRGVAKQISDQLNQIFRHMFPGLAILGAAWVSHPSWFPAWSTLDDGWHLAVLGAIALTVGNVWYVVHRFTLHQLIDYCLYAIKHDRKLTGYLTWLGNHVDQSFHIGKEEKRLSDHVHFHSAQVIFLFIIAEAIIIFSYKPETCTFFDRHRCLSLSAGAALFLWCLFVQYPLTYSLDVFFADRYGKKQEFDSLKQPAKPLE